MWLSAVLLGLVALSWGGLVTEDVELVGQAEDMQNRPVIGILSLPNQGDYNLTGTSFIDAGYVKWIESGGARVVPIIITRPWSEIQYVVERLDGVLFTGGDKAFLDEEGKLTYYAQTACGIYSLVASLNSEGTYYPMWGTCLGFQLLHFCLSQNANTVQYMPDMPGHSALSVFTEDGLKSKIFNSDLGPHLIFLMSSTNVTFVSHNSGVPPSEYTTNTELSFAYRILTTMTTLSGQSYVGLIEGRKLPIYGSQFHPEKNQFEWWLGESIPHTLGAVITASYFADFFVEEARKNTNQFQSEAELEPYLIYNWAPYYWNLDPVQVYLFD